MRPWINLKTALMVSAFCAASGPAFAQWYNYDGYQYAPPPPPGRAAYPAYPSPPQQAPYAPGTSSEDFYYQTPRQRPRAAREDSFYGGAPDGYGGSGHAAYEQVDPRSAEISAESSARTMQIVPNPTREPAGTIVVDTQTKHLYLVQADGQAVEYGIGVGRQGFEWKGAAQVKRKAEWPDWHPPKEMLKRRPDLPEYMEGGLENPLGARALYLFQGNKDTMYRIHGTNEPDTIGKAVSSGCIRMMNADVIDLYKRVPVGTRVVVM